METLRLTQFPPEFRIYYMLRKTQLCTKTICIMDKFLIGQKKTNSRKEYALEENFEIHS